MLEKGQHNNGDHIRAGIRMVSMPFSPWPSFDAGDIEATSRVLKSGKVNYWTGTEGRDFEKEFAEFVGTRHAVAVANGTIALELALRATGIGVGDEIILTPRTFVASASAVVLLGAKPVFADVDPDSQNITAKTVAAVLTIRTKAILAVHLAGWPCEMEKLQELASTHGLILIEDCAQAHGATYRGKSVGGFGDAAAWSFCQDKIMTTAGEGGMVTTNTETIWEKVWSFKDHGKAWDTVYNRRHDPGFRWLHESFGTNGRLTEFQSAIGRRQLKKMLSWKKARSRNAAVVLDACENFQHALRVPRPPLHLQHAWYKCYVFVRPTGLKPGWTRDRLIVEISKRGVPCFSGSCAEIYQEKAFDHTGLRPTTRLPVARELGETSLMFLVHPTLRQDEMQRTHAVITKVFNEATD